MESLAKLAGEGKKTWRGRQALEVPFFRRLRGSKHRVELSDHAAGVEDGSAVFLEAGRAHLVVVGFAVDGFGAVLGGLGAKVAITFAFHAVEFFGWVHKRG